MYIRRQFSMNFYKVLDILGLLLKIVEFWIDLCAF